MEAHRELLGPVVALAAWTMVMWGWMYATRLPAMRAARMKPDPTLDGALAWAYVALRIVHSVFQATVNRIEVRFVLFALSSLVLVAMIVRAAMGLA